MVVHIDPILPLSAGSPAQIVMKVVHTFRFSCYNRLIIIKASWHQYLFCYVVSYFRVLGYGGIKERADMSFFFALQLLNTSKKSYSQKRHISLMSSYLSADSSVSVYFILQHVTAPPPFSAPFCCSRQSVQNR